MAALAVGPYVPELGHPFHVDDAVQILENPAVTKGVPLGRYFTDRETTSTRADYNTRIWRPVRALAFRAMWRLGLGTPLGVVNSTPRPSSARSAITPTTRSSPRRSPVTATSLRRSVATAPPP